MSWPPRAKYGSWAPAHCFCCIHPSSETVKCPYWVGLSSSPWKFKDKGKWHGWSCWCVPGHLPLTTNRRLKCLHLGDIYSFHIINRTFKAKLSFPTLSPQKTQQCLESSHGVAFVSCIKEENQLSSWTTRIWGGTLGFHVSTFLSVSTNI